MVDRLERDLPELLNFYRLARYLWRKLRTTTVIERCFVEVREDSADRRVHQRGSVDRIIYAIFNRFNEDWKTTPSNYLHK